MAAEFAVRGAAHRATDLSGESKETLDRFADVLLKIREEDAAYLHEAPHTLPVSRPDEVKAAKEPVLRWRP